jgi:hypothetical protein
MSAARTAEMPACAAKYPEKIATFNKFTGKPAPFRIY